MIVKFWGTRGSIPVPGPATQIYGGNTPCVEIRAGEKIFICDAGSGIRLLSDDLKRRMTRSACHIFLSHLHPAHIQGLPFFDPLYASDVLASIYARPSDLARLKQMTSANGELSVAADGRRCSATFHELGESALEIGALTVRSFPLNHPGGCAGFAFQCEDKKVVYIPDNELAIREGDKFPDPNHEAILLRHCPRELLDAAKGADLLIMDAQFTDEEYQHRRGAGHSSCLSATDFALQAGVQELALFHHDPKSSDLDLEERARLCAARATKFGTMLTVFPAREGMALQF